MDKDKAIDEADSILEKEKIISKKRRENSFNRLGYILFTIFILLVIFSWVSYGYASYQLGWGFIASLICFRLAIKKEESSSDIPSLNKMFFYFSIIIVMFFLGKYVQELFIID